MRSCQISAEVIAQPARKYLPFPLAAGFRQGGEEAFTISAIPEDVLPLVAAIHQLIQGARILKAQCARHSGRLSHLRQSVNCED